MIIYHVIFTAPYKEKYPWHHHQPARCFPQYEKIIIERPRSSYESPRRIVFCENHYCDDTPVTSSDFFKIVVILDASGSMSVIQKDMKKAINDLITEQKQVKERPATFTLVKFSDNVQRVIENKRLEDINPLEDYSPSGSTALYDAIGDTISWFRNEKNVLMVIVTDGQENASRRYSRSDVTRMIESKNGRNGWSFVYLSNDLKTFEQGNNIGLQRSAFTTNAVVGQNDFGNYLGNNLNTAIKNYRMTGESIQNQLN